ncbi:hypothetical protein H8356DRAFT_1402228 [Neocallimastix lanati (nom. inval.)]|nr:hypothetical protein H8356DRAFT_1402228 [Neocallimastix sp. JGI-2020a]
MNFNFKSTNIRDIQPFTERNISNLEWIEKDDLGFSSSLFLDKRFVKIRTPFDFNLILTKKKNHRVLSEVPTSNSVTGSNPKTNVEINSSKINKIIHNIENYRNSESCWTYDTGASEYITNNKNILDNFKKINNYDFEGYGTYKGLINNNFIELKKVYFSKDTNKNLIIGIKLAEENKIEGLITNFNAFKNIKNKKYYYFNSI